jgi:hypothetical protein
MDGTKYQIVARDTRFTFTCALTCQVAAYQVRKGEMLTVISDGDGLYSVYVKWADGALSRLPAWQINVLAGFEIIAREPVTVGGMK